MPGGTPTPSIRGFEDAGGRGGADDKDARLVEEISAWAGSEPETVETEAWSWGSDVDVEKSCLEDSSSWRNGFVLEDFGRASGDAGRSGVGKSASRGTFAPPGRFRDRVSVGEEGSAAP